MGVYEREKPFLDRMVEKLGRGEMRSDGDDFVLRCPVNLMTNQVAFELRVGDEDEKVGCREMVRMSAKSGNKFLEIK